ncbi:MAG: hypothetical protein M1486_04555 [Gammaproteobacteria bacterium]|nr:hypothetical protein [Gammaproteobacteria bacterium]
MDRDKRWERINQAIKNGEFTKNQVFFV